MGRKKRQQPSCSKSDDIAVPKKTLAQSNSSILAGTLVWSKFKDWPWWPGKTLNLILKDLIQLSLIKHFIHPLYRCDRDQCRCWMVDFQEEKFILHFMAWTLQNCIQGIPILPVLLLLFLHFKYILNNKPLKLALYLFNELFKTGKFERILIF